MIILKGYIYLDRDHTVICENNLHLDLKLIRYRNSFPMLSFQDAFLQINLNFSVQV